MVGNMDVHGSYPRIVVAGAGSVGCFVGGMLARGMYDVTLLLRPRLAEELSRQGLTLTDYAGLDEELSPDMFSLATDPECLSSADIVLVTVKSGATAEMAGLIAKHAPKAAVVVSLQNGVQNVRALRDALPGWDVRAGMVPFNVVSMGGGRFHRGTSGDIVIERGPGHVARTLSVGDLECNERRHMEPIQWGKLLINLNNALNALSGLPLRKQIGDIRWRRLMADQMTEALTVLRAAGIEAANPVPGPLALRHVPRVLRLPNVLFNTIARTMLSIDPTARSSMWEDLQNGRPTEIAELQGLIVSMGREHGVETPINARVAALVQEAERLDRPPEGLTPRQVRTR